MAENLPLGGLCIAGFRSFTADAPQRISPLSKVHLLAGPNNSGKSNVLRVAQRALPALARRDPFELAFNDRPYGQPDAPLRVGVARNASIDELRERLGLARQADLLFQLLSECGLLEVETGLLWFDFEFSEGVGHQQDAWQLAVRQAERVTQAAEAAGGARNQLADLSSTLTQQAGGAREDDAARILTRIVNSLEVRTGLPSVQTIDAFRQIAPSRGVDGDLNGPGLIERLARLQHPPYGQESDRERFDRINVFLGTLFDDPETRIEIQHDHSEILVVHAGRRLPLANYGTGLHQAVILASAATVLSDHLICVEEPEVHLHPTLQRKLLRYLNEQTDNQYLIATHSAHMLDAAYASISGVRQVEGASRVSAALTPQDVATISAELGLRASDLVQSNVVVWVEGPSDRLYLRSWLTELAPDLIEGIHFSLLFYGGALLRHLSPEDPAVQDFISLPRVNRNFWVIMDSDRHAEDEALGETKVSVCEAMAAYAGLGGTWVTAGYTIENYVPPDLLRAALKEVHPQSEPSWAGERYVNPLALDQLGSRKSSADKAAVARAVVERWGEADEWPLDLGARVDELAKMIRLANDLPWRMNAMAEPGLGEVAETQHLAEEIGRF